MAEYAGKEFLDQATQSLQGGQFQQALELVGNAIALSPDNADAYVLKGIAESQLNKPHEAVESFQKAMALDPSGAKAPYNLAVHYYGSGQKEQALEAARQAIAADPAHASARDLLTRIEAELNIAPPAVPGAPTGPEPPVTPAAFTPVGDATGYRQGYEGPLHSLPWLENIAPAWTLIGWILTVAILGLGIVFWIGFGPEVAKIVNVAMSNPNAAKAMQSNMPQGLHVLGIVILCIRLFGGVWMIIDLIDRRGPWLWLLPFLLCAVCGICTSFGLESVTMGAYLLTSRLRK